MASPTRTGLLLLILLLSIRCASYEPTGVCFVPTKLSDAAGELATPLLSPESPDYKRFYDKFIDPMLKGIADDLGILERGTKHKLNSKSNVEVYYIDNFNDRTIECVLYIFIHILHFMILIISLQH